MCQHSLQNDTPQAVQLSSEQNLMPDAAAAVIIVFTRAAGRPADNRLVIFFIASPHVITVIMFTSEQRNVRTTFWCKTTTIKNF